MSNNYLNGTIESAAFDAALSLTSTPSCSDVGADSYDYDCPCCDYYKPSHAILFPWVVELIGIVINFVLIQTNAPIPYAAIMFLLGTLLGIIATLKSTGCCNIFILSTLQWTRIDSNVLLLVILPGLILRDAMEVNFDVFMLALGQLLVLAYPMVLIGTVLTGVAAYYCLPWDWPWSLTLTLGSILGSTDPIAVASVLKRLGAPPRLQLHLGGESTLNDGSAMVFFNVFSQMWFASFSNSEVDDVSIGSGFALFFQNALGGFTIGLVFAIGLLITLYQLDKRLEPEYDILQASAALTFSYLSYYVADQLLSMSGVTASVTCGILAKAFGRGFIQNEKGMIDYLSLMEFLLNTLLFSLGGVVWGAILTRDVADSSLAFSAKEEWFWLFVMYLLVMIIRMVQVASIYPILSRIGLKSNVPEAIFLSFAGMRGAVGIALALSLYRRASDELPASNRSLTNSIFYLVGGISLFTLLINGTVAPWVLKWLKLIQPSDRKRALELFEISAKDFVLHQYRRLLMLPRFQGASYHAIQKYVPFVTEDCEHIHRRGGGIASLSFNSVDRGGPLTASALSSDDEELEAFSKRITDLSERLVQSGSGNDGNAKDQQQELEKEIRHMFLDMVYHTYVQRVQLGEIDDEHAMRNNPEWMRQNLDVLFPSSSSSSNEDFDNFASAPAEEMWWNRLEKTLTNLLSRKTQQSISSTSTEAQREYQQTRPMVQRTVAFIGAHRVTEKKFLAYMELLMDKNDESQSDFGHIETAVQHVLEESHQQVEIARAKLEALPNETVRKVKSQVVASILLKKLAKFVADKVLDEALTPKEAQVYIDLIATKKEELKVSGGDEIPDVSLTKLSDSKGTVNIQPNEQSRLLSLVSVATGSDNTDGVNVQLTAEEDPTKEA